MPRPRTHADVALGIRLTSKQKEWLDANAERLERPINWLIRSLVDRAIAARETFETTNPKPATK